ncbi:MAG: GNAT family protein [Eubacteriales bacterium]|nr:GNAT family protein [Eubacteriales bacterium]
MRYQFLNMNETYAGEIRKWAYEGEYAIYSYANSESLFDVANWQNIYAVLNEDDDLVGEVTFYNNTSDGLENSFETGDMFYGQGMRPDLIGKGYGPELILQALQFGIDKYDYRRECIFLDVLSFNVRAIKAYEKCGFRFDRRHSKEYDGVQYDFVRMYYKNSKKTKGTVPFFFEYNNNIGDSII